MALYPFLSVRSGKLARDDVNQRIAPLCRSQDGSVEPIGHIERLPGRPGGGCPERAVVHHVDHWYDHAVSGIPQSSIALPAVP